MAVWLNLSRCLPGPSVCGGQPACRGCSSAWQELGARSQALSQLVPSASDGALACGEVSAPRIPRSPGSTATTLRFSGWRSSQCSMPGLSQSGAATRPNHRALLHPIPFLTNSSASGRRRAGVWGSGASSSTARRSRRPGRCLTTRPLRVATTGGARSERARSGRHAINQPASTGAGANRKSLAGDS